MVLLAETLQTPKMVWRSRFSWRKKKHAENHITQLQVFSSDAHCLGYGQIISARCNHTCNTCPTSLADIEYFCVSSPVGKYDTPKLYLETPRPPTFIHTSRIFSPKVCFCPAWCLVDGSCGLPRTFESRLKMSEALSPSVCEELIRRADQEVHGLDKNALPMVMGKYWCHWGLQSGSTWSLLIQRLFSLNDTFRRTGRSIENVSVFSAPAKTHAKWKCQYLTTNMDVSESTEAKKDNHQFLPS